MNVSMLARLAVLQRLHAWTNLIPAYRALSLSQARSYLNGLARFAGKVKLFLIRN